MRQKLFGTRSFYKRVFSLMIPIMIQNGITNLVNMLDNIMVGRVGTEQMTGVAVANQLFFVFNLCIFGAVSGAGIFVAQYFGQGYRHGVRETFRFKMFFCLSITALGFLVFLCFGKQLIASYLMGEGTAESIALSMNYAKEYMYIMMIGVVPYTIAQCYSGTLRETNHAVAPMLAGVAAVFVNLGLNYVFIFNHGGYFGWGAVGAAIATVISRFVEMFVLIIWVRQNPEKNRFIVGAFRHLYISKELTKKIIVKALPLMLNETMWAAGIAMLSQCYSRRSYNAVAAVNITQTYFNVFSVAFMAVGVSIGIIVGQQLGAGKGAEAKDTAQKLIVFSFIISVVVGTVFFVAALFIPKFYNTTQEIRALSKQMMCVCAALMPLDAVANACYFTLRSGGKTFITFLFDSFFVWTVNVTTALALVQFTAVPVIFIYAICQFESLFKDIIGLYLVRKGIWVKKVID